MTDAESVFMFSFLSGAQMVVSHGREDALLITGSFFVVAEAMEYSSKIL